MIEANENESKRLTFYENVALAHLSRFALTIIESSAYAVAWTSAVGNGVCSTWGRWPCRCWNARLRMA